jgi:hypothetical protein
MPSVGLGCQLLRHLQHDRELYLNSWPRFETILGRTAIRTSFWKAPFPADGLLPADSFQQGRHWSACGANTDGTYILARRKESCHSCEPSHDSTYDRVNTNSAILSRLMTEGRFGMREYVLLVIQPDEFCPDSVRTESKGNGHARTPGLARNEYQRTPVSQALDDQR